MFCVLGFFYYVYIIKITCQLETEIINIVEIIKKNKQMRGVKSFIDLMKSFYDEKLCREFLEDIKWNQFAHTVIVKRKSIIS